VPNNSPAKDDNEEEEGEEEQQSCNIEVLRDAIKAGVIVACFLAEYDDEEPQLGRVKKDLSETSTSVEVEWIAGAYSRPWKLWKDKKGTWRETVRVNSILCTVTLDEHNKLAANTVDKLKQTYQHMRN